MWLFIFFNVCLLLFECRREAERGSARAAVNKVDFCA